MKSIWIVLFTSLLFAASANAGENGLITKKSAHSAKVTIDRLENILKEKGITVALRWSHSDRAKSVGIELRPTELIIFGNPKLGSHMFTSKQTAGIDLPMKALAWEDENGQTWLSYNDPAWFAARHGISDRPEIVKKMTGALKKFTDKAAAPSAETKRPY
jgi:uncharacterized protein (DUF302 family)